MALLVDIHTNFHVSVKLSASIFTVLHASWIQTVDGTNRRLRNVGAYTILPSIFGPCGLFLVPKVKILTKRSPISDSRGDRRKLDKGPSRHPAKHVPGSVPELEKKSWAWCIKSGGQYFEGEKFD